jgi:hypothetical protein
MKLREKVYAKYGGRCAYTGRPLGDDWQIDHVTPKIKKKSNSIDNLVPSLKIINHYKRGYDIERFRTYIKTLQSRIDRLPKFVKEGWKPEDNPEAPAHWIKSRLRQIKRTAYIKEVARLFGITKETPFTGRFYFEEIENYGGLE